MGKGKGGRGREGRKRGEGKAGRENRHKSITWSAVPSLHPQSPRFIQVESHISIIEYSRSWEGLTASWEGLRDSWSFGASWEGEKNNGLFHVVVT